MTGLYRIHVMQYNRLMKNFLAKCNLRYQEYDFMSEGLQSTHDMGKDGQRG